MMVRLMVALAILLPGCFAASDGDGCRISMVAEEAASCGEGGCQGTFVGCGEIDPTSRLAAEFAAVEPACVRFAELDQWRCYWSAE